MLHTVNDSGKIIEVDTRRECELLKDADRLIEILTNDCRKHISTIEKIWTTIKQHKEKHNMGIVGDVVDKCKCNLCNLIHDLKEPK